MPIPTSTLIGLARQLVDGKDAGKETEPRDNSHQAMAERMFGTPPAPNAAPDPNAAPKPEAKPADPKTAEQASPARTEEELADKLYGSPETLRSMYEPQLKETVDRLTDHAGWSAAERDAYLNGVSETFSDMRMPTDQAALLHGLMVHHLESPPDEATRTQWETAARKELRERYGVDEGNRRLEAATQFVAARPALAQLLGAAGISSHPRLVMALTERVGELRMQPRKRG